jgi:hypothetical protein
MTLRIIMQGGKKQERMNVDKKQREMTGKMGESEEIENPKVKLFSCIARRQDAR